MHSRLEQMLGNLEVTIERERIVFPASGHNMGRFSVNCYTRTFRENYSTVKPPSIGFSICCKLLFSFSKHSYKQVSCKISLVQIELKKGNFITSCIRCIIIFVKIIFVHENIFEMKKKANYGIQNTFITFFVGRKII